MQQRPQAHRRKKEIHHVRKQNPIKAFMSVQVHSEKIQKTVICSTNVQKMMTVMIWPSQNSHVHRIHRTMKKNANAINHRVAQVIVRDR